jgi:hypothetical protein
MADPPEVAAAKRAAATSTPESFVHEWLLSSNPFAFRGIVGSYAGFRAELSGLLSVHAAEMTVVGSAQLGFSLRPDQLLRRFRDESDLDVVVVSSEIFDAAWRDLLIRSTNIRTLEEDERKRLRRTQENFFAGYLRPDVLPTGTALVKDWFPRLAGPFRSPVAARHAIKAWLFKSWWHVERFYSDGLSRVQPEISRLLRK